MSAAYLLFQIVDRFVEHLEMLGENFDGSSRGLRECFVCLCQLKQLANTTYSFGDNYAKLR